MSSLLSTTRQAWPDIAETKSTVEKACGIVLSVALHVAVIIVLTQRLQWTDRDPLPAADRAISVEVVTVFEETDPLEGRHEIQDSRSPEIEQASKPAPSQEPAPPPEPKPETKPEPEVAVPSEPEPEQETKPEPEPEIAAPPDPIIAPPPDPEPRVAARPIPKPQPDRPRQLPRPNRRTAQQPPSASADASDPKIAARRDRPGRMTSGARALQESERAAGAEAKLRVAEDARRRVASGPPSNLCDQLAANPVDPYRKAAGVPIAVLAADEAIAACRQAAQQHPDEPRFQYQLARALHKGGAFVEAMRWYRKAAEHEHAGALNGIGHLYFRGRGVRQDYREGLKWFRRATRQWNAHAQNNVGTAYYRGLGVTRDFGEALDWFRRSAAQGQGYAMNYIGFMFANGQGVERDLDRAYYWYSLAIRFGSPHARKNRADISGGLQATTRSEIEKMAAAWLPMG